MLIRCIIELLIRKIVNIWTAVKIFIRIFIRLFVRLFIRLFVRIFGKIVGITFKRTFKWILKKTLINWVWRRVVRAILVVNGLGNATNNLRLNQALIHQISLTFVAMVVLGCMVVSDWPLRLYTKEQPVDKNWRNEPFLKVLTDEIVTSLSQQSQRSYLYELSMTNT